MYFKSHHPFNGASLSWLQRIGLLLISFGVLCLFLLSWSVEPDPSGRGTHLQFGLPPCLFQIMFGVPCPSCGGTTSFAHFVRGEWSGAIRANAAAFLGALFCALMLPWSAMCVVRGRSLIFHHPLRIWSWSLVFIAIVAIGQWVIRLIIN